MKSVLLIFLLTAAAPTLAAIQFVTTSLPNVEVGQTYDQQIVVSGATGTPVFAVGSGFLPEGLSMNSSGHITGVADHTTGPPLGTSTSPNNPDGSRTYQFQVNVQDGSNLIQRDFNIRLWAAGAMPKGDSGGGSSKGGGCTTSTGSGGLLLFAATAVVLGIRRRGWPPRRADEA